MLYFVPKDGVVHTKQEFEFIRDANANYIHYQQIGHPEARLIIQQFLLSKGIENLVEEVREY